MSCFNTVASNTIKPIGPAQSLIEAKVSSSLFRSKCHPASDSCSVALSLMIPKITVLLLA
ncbi:hypothetical protein FOCC_FOCC001253 [Frankliniella occidentalis]|nr:hypothetical protein FOCC_FOCC001253 [Frankliniella occidentalis]